MPITAPVLPPRVAVCLLDGRSVLLADDGHEAGTLEDVLWRAGASVLLAQNAYQAELITCHHALAAAVIDAELGADTLTRITACLEFHAVPYVLVSATPLLYAGICPSSELLATLARLDGPRLH